MGIKKGRNHLYVYVKNNSVNLYDLKGLAEVCIRRFDFGPPAYLFPPRHCYMRWSDGSGTITYDTEGTHDDGVPNTWFKICIPIEDKKYSCSCNEECLKNYMDSQDYREEENHGYKFFKHNCCDSVRNAIASCGCDIPFWLKITNAGY